MITLRCVVALILPILAVSLGTAQAQDSFGRPPPAKRESPPQVVQPPAPLSPQPNESGVADALTQMERQDFGIPPTAQLHAGAMHGPTPASIPGGQLITTRGLVELIEGKQLPVLILDVLGGPELIPGAQYAVPAHQPGTFSDSTQQQFGQFLQQATGGRKDRPLVFYCQSTYCWMSYNAALRAINLGYTNVLWYRGGVEAWKQAGQAVQPAQHARR
jgi:PQQ-dependent catabolism-associated CXXCW motif protein